MHGRSQVALLCGRGAGDAQAPEDSAALQIEVRRGELHRMAWYHTPVQGVEPARVPVVPGALAHQRVAADAIMPRSEEHTSELQSQSNLVCRLLLEKKKKTCHPAAYLPRMPWTLQE